MLMEGIYCKILLIYLLLLNIGNFMLFGWDKQRARRGEWRSRESSFFLLALLGGALGGWLGMRVFHHKTRHLKFRWGFPLIILLQLCLVFYFCKIS